MDPLNHLRTIESEVQREFEANQRVMGFDTYFGALCEKPQLHLRTAAQYLYDCINHYGKREERRPEGVVSRYKLFDCEWDEGRQAIVGQEDAQEALVRQLRNFVRDGRVTQLMLLHGPNGSAKTSFIQCISKGLEHYSTLDEGAIYRFSWIFPTHTVAKKRLGFGSSDGPEVLKSYAELDEDDVDARLPGDLRDHPLLLIPRERRQNLLKQLRESGAIATEQGMGDYLENGDLSPRSRAIADALITAYHGDFHRMLQHVQIERFYFSRRYRSGIVTVEPQMHVDANMRQVTMDKGLQSLPPALRHLNLFEPQGDLVEANRGLIEYNDLLKKPVDAYKYLLATCEKGTVSLPNAILHLDTVFVASSNEQHLNAFKEYPDFPSFKGRMALIRMPYLRNYRIEQEIYEQQITSQGLSPVVPHATYVLALWAVMTRLKAPKAEHYDSSLKEIIAAMTPLEKAELLAGERTPQNLSSEQAHTLRQAIPTLLAEQQEDAHYEGSTGASPRIIKTLLLNAYQNEQFTGLNPLGIFEELEELQKMKSVYAFLRIEAKGAFNDNAKILKMVVDRYYSRLNEDIQESLGLVGAGEYDDLFSRYIQHVKCSIKGEKVYNQATKRHEDPDTKMMDELEGLWKITEKQEDFRSNLLTRIAAYRIDFPGEDIDYRQLFPKLFDELEQDYFEKQKKTIHRGVEGMLKVIQQEPGASTRAPLSSDARNQAEAAITYLCDKLSYPREALGELLAALLRNRY